MEPTTQVPLVVGLLALLALLLGGRSVSRRRARRPSAPTKATPARRPVEQPEPEVVHEPEVAQSEAQPEQPARRRGLFSRRRSAEVVDPAAVETPLGETVADETVAGETPVVETPDQAELRALREQLRALERVVQQQAADHPTAVLSRVEETTAAQSAAYLRQVSYVVRGLAAYTSEDEDPRRTLARVAAAVERLGVPNEMERPILPMIYELPARQQPDALSGPKTESVDRVDPVIDGYAGMNAVAAVDVQEHEEQQAEPSIPVAPAPVPAAPSYSELAAAARYEEASAPVVHEAVVTMEEVVVPAAYEPETEGGIPVFHAPEAVLPVPPPATLQPSGRRGRLRKSR